MSIRPRVSDKEWAAVMARIEAKATPGGQGIQNQDLSNLSLSGSSNLNHSLASSSSGIDRTNLSNLKASASRNPNKLTRRQLSDNPALVRLLEWGVDEPMIYVWADDHGIAAMVRESNRLEKLPDVFFKPQYGPVNTQKGRFFNRAMQELRKAKALRQGN